MGVSEGSSCQRRAQAGLEAGDQRGQVGAAGVAVLDQVEGGEQGFGQQRRRAGGEDVAAAC
jgi:hypothetical protein